MSWSEPYHIIVEIENDKCRVLSLLREVGVEKFKVTDIRGISGGSVRHLVELLPEQLKKLPKDCFMKISGKHKPDEKRAVWIESDGCDVCNTILSHGSFLVSGKSNGSKIMYSFIAPDYDSYKSILMALQNRNFKIKVLKIGKFKLHGKVLTERQEKVLWLAYKMGFFDYPRKINTTTLSSKLGINKSSLSEIIRRGLRRLLEYYFEYTP